jgi:hypothetical protein
MHPSLLGSFDQQNNDKNANAGTEQRKDDVCRLNRAQNNAFATYRFLRRLSIPHHSELHAGQIVKQSKLESGGFIPRKNN